MKFIENVSYSEIDTCKYDMYLPEAENFSTVVFFHGGGLSSGNKYGERFSGIGKNFVEKGYAFISVEYRQYPNAKFPEYLEDAAAAVAHVKANIGKYGGNDKVYVSGASAGAWLSVISERTCNSALGLPSKMPAARAASIPFNPQVLGTVTLFTFFTIFPLASTSALIGSSPVASR